MKDQFGLDKTSLGEKDFFFESKEKSRNLIFS